MDLIKELNIINNDNTKIKIGDEHIVIGYNRDINVIDECTMNYPIGSIVTVVRIVKRNRENKLDYDNCSKCTNKIANDEDLCILYTNNNEEYLSMWSCRLLTKRK